MSNIAERVAIFRGNPRNQVYQLAQPLGRAIARRETTTVRQFLRSVPSSDEQILKGPVGISSNSREFGRGVMYAMKILCEAFVKEETAITAK